MLVEFKAEAFFSIPEERFQIENIIISTTSGDKKFQIELAETPGQRRQGLQNRKKIPLNTGMLFIFNSVEPVSMWMKNTLISLDMLFLSLDGIVVKIVKETKPLSLKAIFSKDPIKGVLEIRAGSVKRLKIKVGDRVYHPAFNK